MRVEEMNKLTKIIENKKQIKYAVNERLSKEKRLTKKTVRLLKYEAREAKNNFRDAKKIRRERQVLKSKIKLKKNYLSKNTFKTKNGHSLKKLDLESKKLNLVFKKKQLLITKKTLNKANKIRNNSGLRGVVKRKISQTVHSQIQKVSNQEETLAEWNKIKREANTRSNIYFGLKGIVTNTSKLTFKLTKGSYGLANRSLNYSKGKGFIRTPIQNSLLRKQQKKLRRLRQRLHQNKFIKTTKFLGKSTSKIAGFINNFL